MNRVVTEKRWTLRDRVSRAYYDYGRLCSAHPLSCFSISIITILFLSYPAFLRIRLPASSPMDVYWSQRLAIDPSENDSMPEWLYLSPSVYIQQVIVQATVEPWDPESSDAIQAVKGALSRAFKVVETVRTTKTSGAAGSMDYNSLCFRVHSKAASVGDLLPSHSCAVLSPAQFWKNDMEGFYKDGNVISTMFRPQCNASMCVRDILFGAPTRLTGIKQSYRTNRERTIQYAVTFLQSRYSSAWKEALVDELSREFELQQSRASDEDTFVHVFYRPRKYFADYFPLFVSYALCMLYFYYTVKKFEMVKSKWRLAFASFVTVFATLSVTSGICARFDLTPTLWGAGLYPYLAMIVGLENIMCITRSVVYTPPSLDVASRLSHGLSHEGYSITKYFLLELAFLGAGYVTMVPEIQEFCTFASIGLVVDFYMQLFFYAPCLIFDLSRMGVEDKQRFSLMLFNTDIRKLRNYPNPRCPARMLLPWMFTGRQRLNRRFSDTNLRSAPKREPSQPGFKKLHRRTMSSEKASMYAQETIISNRLRVLYYWTKTRFFQRLIMVLFALWVLWLAFIVHKWRLFDVVRDTVMRNRSGVRKEAFGTSHHMLETAPLEWGEWQRQTFKWWPVVWQEYNISLSGHYVSFLPPIVLRASVPPNDASVLARGEPTQYDASVDHDGAVADGNGADENPELKNRIYWLERQMTAMLVVSTLLPFSVVLLFILYVCLWDRWTSYRNAKQAGAAITAPVRRRRPSKANMEVAPLVFSRHDLPIECVSVSGNVIVSSSLDGRVLVWDASTGELKETLNRSRPAASASFSEPSDVAQNVQLRQRSMTTLRAPSSVPSASNSSQQSNLGVPQEPNVEAFRGSRANRPQIWCMDSTHKVVAMGCSSGSVEFGGTETGRLLGSYDETSVGVVHIQVRGSHIILARLNGTLEMLEYNFTSERQDQVTVKRLTFTRAHKQAITCLHTTTLLVFSASYDCTVKAYDARAMRLLHTLTAHTAPVVQILADERSNTLFSCCEMGVVCCWNLESGKLLRTLNVEGNTSALKLGCTDSLLLAFGSDANLCLWDKRSGQMVDRMAPESDDVKSALARMISEGNHLAVLSDQVAVTSNDHIVHFWDLALKAVVRQVQLPGTVDIMRAIDHSSVLCCSGTDMYRLKVPVTYRG